MLKLLSLHLLLSRSFYHKGERCTYAFKKPVGNSLLFVEADPKLPYRKRELGITFEHLFRCRELELIDEQGGKSTKSIFDYFEEQYNEIKAKLNKVKNDSDMKQLLFEIDPFLSSGKGINTSNIKSFKHDISTLLEEDWQEITGYQQGKGQDSGQQAVNPDFYSMEELGEFGFTYVNLRGEMDKSPSVFATHLENTYLRNETAVRKGLGDDNMTPFLALLAADYMEKRMYVLASDIEMHLLKIHCHIEAVGNEGSMPAKVGKVFSDSNAAFTKVTQEDNSFFLILLGAFAKIDERKVLITIKIDLPQKSLIKSEGSSRSRLLQKKLVKFLRNPELHSEISYGLNDFLSRRSFKIDCSTAVNQDIKKKIDDILKSKNLAREFEKLLPVLGRNDVLYILAAMADRRKDKIKDIVLIAIHYYLKIIAGSRNFNSDFNLLRSIKLCADNAHITFQESDWGGVVAEILTLMKSAVIDKKLFFLILENFFGVSPFAAAYRNLSEIEAGEISAKEDYISLCMKIFDHKSWVKQHGKYSSLKQDTKDAVTDFLLGEALFRLDKPHCVKEIKDIRDILEKLNIELSADTLRLLITDIPDNIMRSGRLEGSAEEVSHYFDLLEIFFHGLVHLTTYKEFSQICTTKELFSDDEYVDISLKIFNNGNWISSSELNKESKDIIKKFIMGQAVYLLPEAHNREKINQNKKVLDNLGIALAAEDIEPLIGAVESSPLRDHNKREIKNGQGIKKYFDILEDFLSGTDQFNYYTQFAKIKIGQYIFSDYNCVTTALKILDHRNWLNNTLNEETCREIRQLYFNAFSNTKLSQEERGSNLEILHNRLKIPITQKEKNELGKYVKQKIGGLVDLVDDMEELVVKATRPG